MKKIKIFGLLFSTLFLLTACRAKREALDEEDNDKQVNLAVGEKFSVTLESNPTTGYRWEVDEIDKTVLSQLGTEYDADSPQLAGSGGAETFTFEAVGVGETTLTLLYRRSWEDVEPASIYSVRVVVNQE